MLWICYTGDYVVDMLQWRLCCGYVTVETIVDMLKWRLLWICYSGDCCGYFKMETTVDILQWRLVRGYVTVESML